MKIFGPALKWPGFMPFSKRILFFVCVWAFVCFIGPQRTLPQNGQFLLVMMAGATLSAFGFRPRGWRGLLLILSLILALSEAYRGVLALFGIPL